MAASSPVSRLTPSVSSGIEMPPSTSPKHSATLRATAARGQRTVLGARHEPVAVALEPAVERVGRAHDQGRAEQREAAPC